MQTKSLAQLASVLALAASACGATEPPPSVSEDGGPAGDVSAARQSDSPDVRSGACREGEVQACASPGNPLVGACRAGTRICAGGVFGPCSEVLPAAQESCNDVDDNCNGMTDEGCAEGCSVVCASCPAAVGMVADGSLDRPFASLAEALAAADRAKRRRLCVAGGTSCDEAWTYRSDGPLTIGDGIIVHGGYAVTPTGLRYCDSPLRPRTTLEIAASEGVHFPPTVVSGAELGGFVVEVTAAQGSAPADATVAIAIDGAQNVSLGRIFSGAGLGGSQTYGVRITAGGQANIVGSAISAGHGRLAAVAVQVDDGTVNLRHNCDHVLDGNCKDWCADCGPQLGIRATLVSNPIEAPARASAVFVSGKAGSQVVGNMICGGSVGNDAGSSPAKTATVVCEGPGAGTVTGNVITAGNAEDSIGLALLGANPLVNGNHVEGGCGTRSTIGIWLEGSSARLQNNRVLGGTCGTATSVFRALHIKAAGPSDRPDVHSNVFEPLGLPLDCESTGVFLEACPGSGASGQLRNNIISTGVCGTRAAVRAATGAAWQALVSNDLYDRAPDPATESPALYCDEAGRSVTIAEVNARPGASGNLSADPQYAAYPTDFHLTAGSPCVDQGSADAAPDSDGDGQPRPVGAGCDIGAYEFQPR